MLLCGLNKAFFTEQSRTIEDDPENVYVSAERVAKTLPVPDISIC